MELKKVQELLKISGEKRNLHVQSNIDIEHISRLIGTVENAMNVIDSDLLYAFNNIPTASNFILEFVLSLLKENKYEKILDPWVNNGQFLNIVSSSTKKGYVINEDVFKLNKILKLNFNQVHGHPQQLLDDEKEKFDLIISNLPVGLSTRRKDFGLSNKDIGFQIIIQSLKNLTDNGQLLVTVNKAVFSNDNFIELIKAHGCVINAIFETPAGSLNSFSRVPFYLIFIKRGDQGPVFLSEIIDDKNHQKKVIENFKAKKSDKDMSKGILKPINEINSISQLSLIKEVDILIRKTGIKPRNIKTFGDFKKENEIEENDEFILIPTFLNAKAKKGSSSDSIKKNAYHIFVINNKVLNIDYFLKFLNSELGKKIFSKYATGNVIQSLNKSNIIKVELPIPDISVQKNMIDLERKLEGLTTYFNSLRDKLWENHRTIGNINKELKSKLKNPNSIEWLEDLPFPLASIFWGYHSESKISKKVDYLFLFFEGLCEFLDTLILSGLNANSTFYNTTVKQWLINEDYKDWHIKSSFGGWHNLFSVLSKKIRTLNNSKDDRLFIKSLFGNANDDFFKMITSSDITKSFVNVSKLRNNFKGHGGIMSDEKLNLILSELEDNFYAIKSLIVDGFSNVRLISIVPKTMGWNEDDKVFETTCRLLKGTRSKFNQIEVQTDKPMSDNKLYLLSVNQFKPLELLPFVQMRQAPRTEHNACYFYNRVEGNQVRLVSYHYDKEEEVFIDYNNISSFLEILNPTI